MKRNFATVLTAAAAVLLVVGIIRTGFDWLSAIAAALAAGAAVVVFSGRRRGGE